MYFSNDKIINLGKKIGQGGAASIYLEDGNPKVALKIFKPEFLQKEHTLANRINALIKISQIADLNIQFGGINKPIGAWPMDIIQDSSKNTVGYKMFTAENGIDLSHVIHARDTKTAFYKYRNKPFYKDWFTTFIYHTSGIKNRLILAYYLAIYFERIYDLRDKQNKPLGIDICNFDIKPNNILVSIESIQNQKFIFPYLLDLDNITITIKSVVPGKSGKIAPLHPQTTPEYMPIEPPLDKFYDYYSIAVIFYQLLFNIHPFMGVQGYLRFVDGTEMNYFVKHKCFPWGSNRKFLSKETQNNIFHSNFKHISANLQLLFIRAFDSDQPSMRPSMHEWKQAFAEMLNTNTISLFAFQSNK